MTTIRLQTSINSDIKKVFDLSRSIDFHVASASQTKEKAIDGKTEGLIKLGETVTWRGKHFGIFLKHTSKIIKMEFPTNFTDIMIKGHFVYFCHNHLFEQNQGKTIMVDILKYKTPYGWFGALFNRLFLKKHLIRFLKERNRQIKMASESQ